MSERLKDWRNKLEGDLDKLREERDAYREEVENVIKPGIEDAKKTGDWVEVLHKRSAYGEEFVDKRPRTAWYGVCVWAVTGLPLSLVGLFVVIRWLLG